MKRAIAKRIQQEMQQDKWRDELQSLLNSPDWSEHVDRVEELAGLLGFTDDDCYWRS